MAHVFISYHKASSREYARKLADYLIEQGFDVWIDDRIDFGTEWERVIFEEGLDTAGALIVVMTHGAWESSWVRSEREYAAHKRIPVFPLRVEDYVFPSYMARQYVDVQAWQLPNLSFLNTLQASGVTRRTSSGVDMAIPPQAVAQARQNLSKSEAVIPSGYTRYQQNADNRNEARKRLEKRTPPVIYNAKRFLPYAASTLIFLLIAALILPRVLIYIGGDITLTPSPTQAAVIVDSTATPTVSETLTPSSTPSAQPTIAPSSTHTPYPSPTIDEQSTQHMLTQAALDATLTADGRTGTPPVTLTHSFSPTETFTSTFSPAPSPSTTPVPPGLSLDTPVTANEQWQPFISLFAREIDGVEMVLVPAGCFYMGGDPGAGSTGGAANGGVQCLPPFWIDRNEVTNVQFELRHGQAAQPSSFSGANLPRENVTWFEARDFCAVRGARLPTEAEWEYAGRGVDALIYPWGNEWNPDNATWSGNSGNSTAEVGSHPNGISWIGAYDLLGNVWEWVSTAYGIDDGDFDFMERSEQRFDYPYSRDDGREQNSNDNLLIRVLRGGSWLNDAESIRATNRNAAVPNTFSNRAGFRCVRDDQP